MASLGLRELAALAAIAFIAPAQFAGADPVVGGFAGAYSWNGGAPVSQAVYYTTSSGASAAADLGPGANISSQSVGSPWVSRIGVTGDSLQGLQFGSALSAFSVNQQIVGPAGGLAHVSYTFGFDGTFTPGSSQNYPVPNPANNIPPQNLAFYLTAHLGTAEGVSVVQDAYGTDFRFSASNGEISLQRILGSPGYVNTIDPYSIPSGFAAGCDVGDTRCLDGGSFNETRTIQFDMLAGQDFYVSGYLAGTTNGTADFMHTAKLLSVSITPGYSLISDDGGALVSAGKGLYRLAGAVPEPSTWGLMCRFALRSDPGFSSRSDPGGGYVPLCGT